MTTTQCRSSLYRSCLEGLFQKIYVRFSKGCSVTNSKNKLVQKQAISTVIAAGNSSNDSCNDSQETLKQTLVSRGELFLFPSYPVFAGKETFKLFIEKSVFNMYLQGVVMPHGKPASNLAVMNWSPGSGPKQGGSCCPGKVDFCSLKATWWLNL